MNEPDKKDDDKKPVSPSDKVRGRIVAITGVLLVVPALLNAAYDIYAVALKLPRSDNERINVELFKKYFGKKTEHEFSFAVKTQYGSVDATFRVYDEGDVLVQYGDHTQWFKFPKPEASPPTKVNWIPLPEAHAGAVEISGTVKVEDVQIKGSFQSSATTTNVIAGNISLKGNTLTNATSSGVAAAGSVKMQSIDIRSGKVTNIGTISIKDATVSNSLSSSSVVRIGTIRAD